MGEGEHHGIVPQFTKELFDRVEGTTDDEVSVGRRSLNMLSVVSYGFYWSTTDNVQSSSQLLRDLQREDI